MQFFCFFFSKFSHFLAFFIVFLIFFVRARTTHTATNDFEKIRFFWLKTNSLGLTRNRLEFSRTLFFLLPVRWRSKWSGFGQNPIGFQKPCRNQRIHAGRPFCKRKCEKSYKFWKIWKTRKSLKMCEN